LFIAAMISALTPVNSNVGQALSTPVTKVRPTVTIEVDASKPSGPLPRIWSYFGYDEPNFTYSANGKKLLKELAQLSHVPIYLRTHNLLDRKSTRLNSSHQIISYAVFCLKKKKKK